MGWGGVEESMPQGLKPTSFAVRFMPGLKSGPISGARARAQGLKPLTISGMVFRGLKAPAPSGAERGSAERQMRGFFAALRMTLRKRPSGGLDGVAPQSLEQNCGRGGCKLVRSYG
jgi:hypothetical protein